MKKEQEKESVENYCYQNVKVNTRARRYVWGTRLQQRAKGRSEKKERIQFSSKI